MAGLGTETQTVSQGPNSWVGWEGVTGMLKNSEVIESEGLNLKGAEDFQKGQRNLSRSNKEK